MDEDGLLKQTGVAVVDQQIDVANEAIARVWKEAAAHLPGPDGRSPIEETSEAGPRRLPTMIRRRIGRARKNN